MITLYMLQWQSLGRGALWTTSLFIICLCAPSRKGDARAVGLEESSPLERILIEQILLRWINLYVREINSATKLSGANS
jgi:hypothetical protein